LPFELRLDRFKEAPYRYEILVQGLEDTDAAEQQAQVPLEVANYSDYIDGWDRLRIVGEAVNTGDITAKNVEISAVVLDENGDVLALSSSNWDSLDLVPPDGIYPFGFSFSEDFEGWKDVELQIQAYPYDEEQSYFTTAQDLSIKNVTGSEPESDWSGYTLAGEVVNDGNVAAKSIKVIVVAYDGAGSVVDLGNASPELEDSVLGPGASAPFELEFPGLKVAPVRYETFIQGREVEEE
ncbi:MAG: FxLYD domain-containing protein, partial [Longimicrobiales bacterium]|nr:FxLYD domain-containing protein [Longimicrobiales bacterium]